MEYIRIVLGGTFNPPIHKGHEALLKRAFELARGCGNGNEGKVTIGLTSDEMACAKDGTVSYKAREKNLNEYINCEFGAEAKIIEINDPYGVTLTEDFEYIIVSEETYNMGLKINEARKERGMPLIEIIKIDYVLDQSGKIISSTRIKKGEIDKDGRLL